MSFTRTKYDECAHQLHTERSVDPGLYRLFDGYSNNCNKCYSYHGPIGSREDSSLTREHTDNRFGNMAEIESELTNRVNPLQECNANPKNDNYKNKKTYHKNNCNNKLDSEDTRFSFPLDNYRGMSLTSYFYTPYLHVNPQCHIQSNRNRDGSASRLVAKDSYKAPEQRFLDNGEALPPKPQEYNHDIRYCK